MKPRLRLGLDGNWYPSKGTLELSRYDPEPLCAAIRLIRRRPEQAAFGVGLLLSASTIRDKVHNYLGICWFEAKPTHRYGLAWKVVQIDPTPTVRAAYGVHLQHLKRSYILELL